MESNDGALINESNCVPGRELTNSFLEKPFDIQPDMSLSEEPESILDRQERVMRNKVIPFVKILWKNHPEREATWETEESMRASYPHFFV
ncbi:putative nucleotidyltransferase, ribonuclease H [Tanacetum coccineum]